jgi:DNA/RNA non-specific endonuclease
MIVYGNHNSQFDLQPFNYGGETQARFRPVTAEAILHNLTSKGKAEPPYAFIRKDDDTYDLMEDFDKGHLIANQFLNENNPFNIVPMYSSFNQKGGAWNEVEGAVAKVVSLGHKIALRIEIEYANPDGRIPSAFLITAQYDNGIYVFFKDTYLHQLRLAHLPTTAVRLTIQELQQQLTLRLFTIAYTGAWKDLQGWQVESLPTYNYIIVKNTGALVPQTKIPRPYAFLDYWWLADPNDNAVRRYLNAKVQGGLDFTPRQKTLIRLVNRVWNGGALVSDYPGDSKDPLIEGSGHDAAQIDHVRPQAAFGPNFFSNAYVSSGLFNNQASAMDAELKYAKKLT